MTVSIVLSLELLFTTLRLIDFRITTLRMIPGEASDQAIDEAVHLTKFRMIVQDRLNTINAGC